MQVPLKAYPSRRAFASSMQRIARLSKVFDPSSVFTIPVHSAEEFEPTGPISTMTAERQTEYAASFAAPLTGNGSAANAGAANAMVAGKIKNALKVRKIASSLANSSSATYHNGPATGGSPRRTLAVGSPGRRPLAA